MFVMPPVFNAGDTVYFYFDTYGSSGESITASGISVTDIECYKNGSTTQRASDSGYALLDTDGTDFDGATGLHGFSIDTSDNSDSGFWADGAQYLVHVNAVTVNSQTVRFSYLLTLGHLLRPTTAGRKLDVSTGGEAGLDWANVGSPTTTVNLSGTTVKDATDVNTDTDALLARLTATRAGYLDNLSGGAVALASALSTVSTRVLLSLPAAAPAGTGGLPLLGTVNTAALTINPPAGKALLLISENDVAFQAETYATSGTVAGAVYFRSEEGNYGLYIENNGGPYAVGLLADGGGGGFHMDGAGAVIAGDVSGKVLGTTAGGGTITGTGVRSVLADAAHGGSSATITAQSIAVTNPSGNAASFISSGAGGHGLYAKGANASFGVDGGHGINAVGGTGTALQAGGDGLRLDGVASGLGGGDGYDLHTVNATLSTPLNTISTINTTTTTTATTVATNLNATVSSRSTLDAAGVRTAVGLASNNLDTQLAAIAAYIDTEVAAVKAVTDQLAAAQAEPTAAPAANATPLQKIAWLAMLARNRVTQTATTQTVYADNGSTVVATSTVSDDGTTFVKGEMT